MGRAEDVIQQVCSLEDIEPGEEWVPVPIECSTSFSVRIELDRKCRQQNPLAVEAEVQALIYENFSENLSDISKYNYLYGRVCYEARAVLLGFHGSGRRQNCERGQWGFRFDNK